jgi:hypothetical protein
VVTFEKDAVVLERNKRLERILWAILGLLTVGGIVQAFFVGGAPYAFYLLGLPLGLLTRASAENWRALSRNARVRAGAEGVSVDGTTLVRPGQILTAVVQPRVGKKPTVRLRSKGRSVIFEMVVEDEAEGVAFLRAIGHDASTKKASFRTLSPLLSTRRR